jgi:hypothetical protein
MRPSHEAWLAAVVLGLSLAGVAKAAIDTYQFATRPSASVTAS